MRFPVILILLAMPAAGATVSLPDPQYSISVGYQIENNGGADSMTGSAPGTYQAGCALSPVCVTAVVSAAPSPTITASATTTAIFLGQFANAGVSISYDYAVLCNLCAPGTVASLTLDGFMQFDYFFGVGSTLAGSSATVDVFGYDAVHGFDQANIAQATVSGNFCVSVFPTSSTTCTSPAAGTFSLPVTARVNEAYQITMGAGAGFFQATSTSQPSFATATIDPVLSFAPGFDSTGYSIEVSPGIGNAAATAPEPATFALFAVGGLLLWRRRGLIMEVPLHGRPQTPGARNHSTHC